MNPRAEYMDALTVFGTPSFAAVSFGLCFAVFGTALLVMFSRTSASLDRQASLPFDQLGTEKDHD